MATAEAALPVNQWRTALLPKEGRDALPGLQLLAKAMDSAVEVPGTKFRIGLDALLGLIPGAGDVISAAIGSYVLMTAARLGVPKPVIARMLMNLGTDAVVGSVPVVGDVFDAAWRANSKNVRLLTAAIEQPQETRRRSRWAVWGIAAAAFAIGVLGLALAIGLAALLVRLVTG